MAFLSWYTEVWTQYLPLLQSDLALFFAADERPVTPEHLVASTHNMGKGCGEETHPVLNHPLGKKAQILERNITVKYDFTQLQRKQAPFWFFWDEVILADWRIR